MFSGKKTYIVSFGAALLAIGGALHGDYTWPQAAQLIVEAAIGAALRSGISKIG